MKRALDTYWKRGAAGLGVILISVVWRDYLFWGGVLAGLALVGWGLATWEPPKEQKPKKRKG